MLQRCAVPRSSIGAVRNLLARNRLPATHFTFCAAGTAFTSLRRSPCQSSSGARLSDDLRCCSTLPLRAASACLRRNWRARVMGVRTGGARVRVAAGGALPARTDRAQRFESYRCVPRQALCNCGFWAVVRRGSACAAIHARAWARQLAPLSQPRTGAACASATRRHLLLIYKESSTLGRLYARRAVQCRPSRPARALAIGGRRERRSGRAR